MAVRLQKTVIDATMRAIIAYTIRDLLDFAGLWQSRLYNERVYRPHRYRTGLIRFIKRFAAKKAGVEDGRNQ